VSVLLFITISVTTSNYNISLHDALPIYPALIHQRVHAVRHLQGHCVLGCSQTPNAVFALKASEYEIASCCVWGQSDPHRSRSPTPACSRSCFAAVARSRPMEGSEPRRYHPDVLTQCRLGLSRPRNS